MVSGVLANLNSPSTFSGYELAEMGTKSSGSNQIRIDKY